MSARSLHPVDEVGGLVGSPGRNGRGKVGLTLVELLMAATAFAILMVGFSAHLQGGVTAWRRATSTVERLQQGRVALNRLGQDLSNAYVLLGEADAETWLPSTIFGSESLQFYTVRRTRIVPAPGDPVVIAEGTAWFVTYQLQEEDGDTALVRTAHTLRLLAGGLSVPKERILTGVTGMTIQYGYVPAGAQETPVQWRMDWPDPTTIPKLVQVTMEFGDGERAPRPIRQTFVIPGGHLRLVGDPPA